MMRGVFWLLWLGIVPGLTASPGETIWPEFRGPRGDGSAVSTNLPLRWSETENVTWKTALHGRAWSSPVIWGEQVWVTSATEDGHQLFAICLAISTGQILHDLKVFDVAKPQYCHPFNTYASPTPAIEERRIYVTFGAPGTACIETKTGEVLWTRRDIECNHYRSAGSSPIIHDDKLFLNFDGSDKQFVVALDKASGRTVWRQERSIDFDDLDPQGKPLVEGDYRKAFATCHVAHAADGPVLLSQGSKALYAYALDTGREIWRLEDRSSYSGSTRPVFRQGASADADRIYLPSGFPSGEVLAIRPGKPGEVLDARSTNGQPGMQLHVVWRSKKNPPKKPSLQRVGDLLFAIDDNGTATCWNASTGELRWNQRIGGNFSASPVAAPGRIYFFDEKGKTTVIKADAEFKILAENSLGDGFMASPAVSGDALFLRSRTHLYRVEQK